MSVESGFYGFFEKHGQQKNFTFFFFVVGIHVYFILNLKNSKTLFLTIMMKKRNDRLLAF